nr:hypothetical protein [Tanacetum cinerariifolium]GEY37443.1 hypothetical protein [Tanacetum cinerariifolium]
MISVRSLLLCVRIIMTSRPRTCIPSRPRLGCDRLVSEPGSPPSQVILFGDIPTVIPTTSVITPETSAIAPVISSAALVVEITILASPTGLCGLVPYSNSDSDSPDEMDSPKITTRSSSPYDFLIAPVTASPGSHRRVVILIRLREAIPLGRPYRTHPNGPRRVMTARKRVGPLLARRLAWRHVSPCSPDHRLSSFSLPMDSSPVHSLGLDAPGQAHSGSLTRVVSPRLGYPPMRAPRHSKAFCRWCAALLSTFYPLTTSDSSSGNSSKRPLHSSSHFDGPSRKRCRSLIDSVPSSTPVTRSLAPTRADLLPPRKRFRDSYLSETSMEEDIKINTTETEDGRELDIVDGIDGYEEIFEPVKGDSSSLSDTRDGTVRSVKDIPVDLDGAIRDFYHHMFEVRVHRIVEIETTQRQLEADHMIASGARAGMAESIRSLRSENLK